jgi:hypothetical protein
MASKKTYGNVNWAKQAEMLLVAQGAYAGQDHVEAGNAVVNYPGLAAGHVEVVYKAAFPEMEMPKSALPPLELNLAAKKPEPWDKIKTYQQYLNVREAGMYVEYVYLGGLNGKEYRDVLVPTAVISEELFVDTVKHGCFVHHTKKVRLYRMFLDDGGHPCVWEGPNREMMVDQEFAEYFVKWLSASHFIIY